MVAENARRKNSGLQPEFLELERRLSTLKTQYQRGQLTDEAYQAGVQALTIQDASGTTWWLGGEAGAWQRWDGREWVRDNPPAGAVPAASSLPRQKRNIRPQSLGCITGLIVVVIAISIVLIGGWQVYKQMPRIVEGAEPDAVIDSRYTLSPSQVETVGALGQPQAFAILFYEEEVDTGSFADVRFETWNYYDRGVVYTFINGDLVSEELLEFEILGAITPIPYRPEQFVAYMDLEGVLATADLDRYMVVPLENELVDGGEVYYADELTFGLKNNELLYVESLALEVTE